ncbi:hypothetical protein KDW99_08850 [Marinomonas rhizomae]|uniref:hypothetical protein n=1 Tax=Marinomonas rhizomae TaxID=491948 RepID=UPI002103DB37|nr:hypothetical protein [Marinomonas rhizomae]UTW01216.1 hypothetical protein KDW99_08850 [Marinomonas rhizomae]
MTSTELWDFVSANLMALFGFAASNSIALLSLLVAVLVWWQSRKDAQLAKKTAEFTRKTAEEAAALAKETAVMSVKPLLSISTYNDVHEGLCGARFRNTGLGPAIIDEFKVFLDGNEIKGEQDKSNIYIALERLEIVKCDIGSGNFMKGQAITVENISPIFEIKLDDQQTDSKFMRDKILRIEFFIKYHDLYGNLQEPFDTRINRHLIFN